QLADTRVRADVAVRVGFPSLYESTVGRDEGAVRVEREAAVTRVGTRAALVDDEETVALDREVGRTTGQLGRTLGEVHRDAGEPHTETNLRRVRTTLVGGRRARAAQL